MSAGVFAEKLDAEHMPPAEEHEAERLKLVLGVRTEVLPTLHIEAEAARFNCAAANEAARE